MEMYWDCANGISGDMTLAALAHLGVDFARLRPVWSGPAWPASSNAGRRIVRAGRAVAWTCAGGRRSSPCVIRRTSPAIFRRADVAERGAGPGPGRAGRSGRRPRRTRNRIPAEQVHFHEVGAVDTLVDILGVCWGLEELGVDRVTASPLPWFGGSIECAARAHPPARSGHGLAHAGASRASERRADRAGDAYRRRALVQCAGGWFFPKGRRACWGGWHRLRITSGSGRAAHLGSARDPGAGAGPRCREEVCQLECHLDHLSGEELGAAIEGAGCGSGGAGCALACRDRPRRTAPPARCGSCARQPRRRKPCGWSSGIRTAWGCASSGWSGPSCRARRARRSAKGAHAGQML